MERRAFGKTGLEVSVLGFGGAPIGVLETGQDQVKRLLNLLLDRGVNVIDTAAGYRGSEEAIGQAVGHRRNEFVLISKCGQTFPDLPGEAWSPELISQTIDRSLRRLRTDRLDVMLLHTCDLATLERGEAVGALVKAREQGKIRFAAYSGDNEAAVYAAKHPEIAVIETSINICDQVNIDCVLPIARDRGVGVIVKRPIANAAWKQLNDQPGFYAEYAKTYTERLAEMGVTPRDLGFEVKPQEVWPEIAHRFTLMQPGVHTAIIGTTNAVHAEANIAFADKGPLPDNAARRLRDAFLAAQSKSGETWGGLT
jgi:aryl-alcohol dehydrogenase-like predicted oxidoreductase